MKLRKAGTKKHEKKVFRKILKQEDEYCEYNIHFVHPLQSFTELSGIFFESCLFILRILNSFESGTYRRSSVMRE